MCHEDLCKKVRARADFFLWLAEAMVSSRTNWNDYATAENNSYDTQENTTYKETSHVKQVTGAPACVPVHLNNLAAKLSSKIKICQVCMYELMKPKGKSIVLCLKHGVWLCTEIRDEHEKCDPPIKKLDGSPVMDWSWTCQTSDSYWNKFHTFYKPKGMFNK
jgi:hypothetical protein